MKVHRIGNKLFVKVGTVSRGHLRYRKGDRVRHKTLGDGTVVGAVTGDFMGSRVAVNFDGSGEKELLLDFCVGRIRKLPRKRK
jgi:hypothetical protein